MAAITIPDLENAKVDVDHIFTIANSTALTATDRLGHTKRTLAGIDSEAESRIDAIDAAAATQRINIQSASDVVLGGLGYATPVDYYAGILMNSPIKTVKYNDVVYAPISSQIPFTTSGTFESSKEGVQNSALPGDGCSLSRETM